MNEAFKFPDASQVTVKVFDTQRPLPHQHWLVSGLSFADVSPTVPTHYREKA